MSHTVCDISCVWRDRPNAALEHWASIPPFSIIFFSSFPSLLKFDSLNLNLYSSVLSHQGATVTKQPLFSPDKQFALLWNGEVYSHPDFDHSTSDTEWILSKFAQASSFEELAKLTVDIRGEFAFVFVSFRKKVGPYPESTIRSKKYSWPLWAQTALMKIFF